MTKKTINPSKKQNSQMIKKALFFSAAFLSGWSATAIDQLHSTPKTPEELGLLHDCHGSYQVLKSTPFFNEAIGRVLPSGGVHDKVKIVELKGSGCKDLKWFYGIHAFEGQIHQLTIGNTSSMEQSIELSKKRENKNFSFSATQSFSYQAEDGSLPLFPLMHSENAQLLSLKGKANANGLYGTPDFDELGLEELTELVDAVLPAIKYGKIYQGNSTFFASHNSLLGALLDISDQIENKDTPKDIKQIASDLILVFQNISKNTGSFVSGHPGISVGYEIHKLFSHTSLIDSEFKHKVYLKNPQLFDDQSMSWTFVNGSQSAPKLNEEQIVALSKEALEIVEDLSHVVQLSEARELMAEYKTMAKMFLKFSEKKIHKDLEVYTLNSESLTNLEEILEIDFQ